jgi:hypothetical protein
VLPATKTLALVEYSEPQDARRAFKGMAYRKMRGTPVYLEWAPAGIFGSAPPQVCCRHTGWDEPLGGQSGAATGQADRQTDMVTWPWPACNQLCKLVDRWV